MKKDELIITCFYLFEKKFLHLSFPIFITADIIVPKGLAAFGSIDILHKKRLES
ncbi:hypothetical protein AALA36_07645 [Lachnospiraceae bacterium 66-29]